MTANRQNVQERILDKLNTGAISVEEANIQTVEDLRFKIVSGRIPRQTRTHLNNGVKQGRLGRLKKDGLKPEIYYKVNFEYLAKAEQNKIAKESADVLANIFVA